MAYEFGWRSFKIPHWPIIQGGPFRKPKNCPKYTLLGEEKNAQGQTHNVQQKH